LLEEEQKLDHPLLGEERTQPSKQGKLSVFRHLVRIVRHSKKSGKAAINTGLDRQRTKSAVLSKTEDEEEIPTPILLRFAQLENCQLSEDQEKVLPPASFPRHSEKLTAPDTCLPGTSMESNMAKRQAWRQKISQGGSVTKDYGSIKCTDDVAQGTDGHDPRPTRPLVNLRPRRTEEPRDSLQQVFLRKQPYTPPKRTMSKGTDVETRDTTPTKNHTNKAPTFGTPDTSATVSTWESPMTKSDGGSNNASWYKTFEEWDNHNEVRKFTQEGLEQPQLKERILSSENASYQNDEGENHSRCNALSERVQSENLQLGSFNTRDQLPSSDNLFWCKEFAEWQGEVSPLEVYPSTACEV
jgi:hypothetical protein